MSSPSSLERLPRPIGSVDLEKRAHELRITHFIAAHVGFSRDCRMELVHVSQARAFQQYGTAQAGIDFHVELDDSKLSAVPVPETLVQLPWDKQYAWVACELYKDGEPFVQCPRRALRRVLQQAADKGVEIKAAVELEFMLYEKDSHVGSVANDQVAMRNYLGRKQTMQHAHLLSEVTSCLHELGWQPEKIEKEALDSQYEIVMKYTDALTMADRHFFFKFLIKSLAERAGLRALFMPMPRSDLTGNGMHYNFSLWDSGTGADLTRDPNDERLGLSQLAQQALAGVMDSIHALTAIHCPTVNSYKRLHAFPNFLRLVGYSREARWPVLRVPTAGDRLELRLADGAVNPYLLPASTIAAALNGIRQQMEPASEQFFDRKLELDSPPLEDFKAVPASLAEALDRLGENTVLRELLGDGIVDGFIWLKNKELKEFNKHISQWEIDLADDY